MACTLYRPPAWTGHVSARVGGRCGFSPSDAISIAGSWSGNHRINREAENVSIVQNAVGSIARGGLTWLSKRRLAAVDGCARPQGTVCSCGSDPRYVGCAAHLCGQRVRSLFRARLRPCARSPVADGTQSAHGGWTLERNLWRGRFRHRSDHAHFRVPALCPRRSRECVRRYFWRRCRRTPTA